MRILATVCSKGGVGKTTATANLGGMLADAGYRVLLSTWTLSRRFPPIMTCHSLPPVGCTSCWPPS